MKAIFVILVWTMLAGAIASGAETTVTFSGPKTVRLPFKSTPDGKLYFPATINRQEKVLFIDTGGTTILDLEFARSLGIEPKPSGELAIGITGVAGPHYIAVADLEIGKMSIVGMPVSCVDLSALRRANRVQGLPEFDGQIGSDLLAVLRATIDYNTMKLTIRRPRSGN